MSPQLCRVHRHLFILLVVSVLLFVREDVVPTCCFVGAVQSSVAAAADSNLFTFENWKDEPKELRQANSLQSDVTISKEAGTEAAQNGNAERALTGDGLETHAHESNLSIPHAGNSNADAEILTTVAANQHSAPAEIIEEQNAQDELPNMPIAGANGIVGKVHEATQGAQESLKFPSIAQGDADMLAPRAKAELKETQSHAEESIQEATTESKQAHKERTSVEQDLVYSENNVRSNGLDDRPTVKSVVDKLITDGSRGAQERAARAAGQYAAMAAKAVGYSTSAQIKAASAAAQQVVLGRVLQGASWDFKKLHSELVWPALIAAREAGATKKDLISLSKKHLRIAVVWQEIVRNGFLVAELEDMQTAVVNAKRIGQLKGRWNAAGIATTAAEAAAARIAWEVGSPAIGSLDKQNYKQNLGFLHQRAIERLQETMKLLDSMYNGHSELTPKIQVPAASEAVTSNATTNSTAATPTSKSAPFPQARLKRLRRLRRLQRLRRLHGLKPLAPTPRATTVAPTSNTSAKESTNTTAKAATLAREEERTDGMSSAFEPEVARGRNGGKADVENGDKSEAALIAELQVGLTGYAGAEDAIGRDWAEGDLDQLKATQEPGNGSTFDADTDSLSLTLQYIDDMMMAARFVWDDQLQYARRKRVLDYMLYIQKLAAGTNPKASEKRLQAAYGTCATVGGDPCVIPFTLNGVTYDHCAYSMANYFWCSTRVDANGTHVNGFWGRCNHACGFWYRKPPQQPAFPNAQSNASNATVDQAPYRRPNRWWPKFTLEEETKIAAAAADTAVRKQATFMGQRAGSRIEEAAAGALRPRAALRAEALELEAAVFSARQLAQNVMLGWLPGLHAGGFGFAHLLAQSAATAAQEAAGYITGSAARAWAAKVSRRSWWDTKGELALAKYYLRIVRFGLLALAGQRARYFSGVNLAQGGLLRGLARSRRTWPLKTGEIQTAALSNAQDRVRTTFNQGTSNGTANQQKANGTALAQNATDVIMSAPEAITSIVGDTASASANNFIDGGTTSVSTTVGNHQLPAKRTNKGSVITTSMGSEGMWKVEGHLAD